MNLKLIVFLFKFCFDEKILLLLTKMELKHAIEIY